MSLRGRHSRSTGDAVGTQAPRRDIQVLRALAVALVVACHAKVPGFAGGFVGVDIFFVISGYVITTSLLRSSEQRLGAQLLSFYARRVRRIAPAASLVLSATAIVGYLLLKKNYPLTLNDDIRWASLFGENVRLIHTSSNYFIPGLTPSLVTQFWSLAVEEQFYIVYPLLLLSALAWTPKRARRVVTLVLVGAGVIVSAWWSWRVTGTQPISAYYSPFTRFWEIGLGCLVALLPEHWTIRWRPLNGAVSVGALVVVGVAMHHLSGASVYPGVLAWWPCGATALLLLCGRRGGWAGGLTFLSAPPVLYLGEISYSLYLFHYAWLIMPQYFPSFPNNGLDRVGEVACSLACAMLSYHLIENPIRHSRRLAGDTFASFVVLLIAIAVVWNATAIVNHLVG